MRAARRQGGALVPLAVLHGVVVRVVVVSVFGGIALAAGVGAGCVSAQAAMPAGPLPSSRAIEVGVTTSGHAGLEHTGGLVGGFGRVSFFDRVDVLAYAGGGAALGYPSLLDGVPATAGPGGGSGGVGLGAQLRYPILPALWVGVGVDGALEADGYRGVLQRRVVGRVRFPTAQRLYDDLWVYARPTAAVGFPFRGGGHPGFPFFGLLECPVGLSLQLSDRALVLVEGGYHLPTNGLVLTAGLALQL